MTLLERWDDRSSNSRQQYLTHGVFRYFGKLPPTVTGRILDEVGVNETTTLVDVMSGSGTTLVEAGLRSAAVTGIDCNEIAVIVGKVKTTPIAAGRSMAMIESYRKFFGASLCECPRLDDVSPRDFRVMQRLVAGRALPPIRNFDHWFTERSASLLMAIRDFVDQQDDKHLADILRVAFAASIRSSSNASTRTGRLFRDADKSLPNPVSVVLKRLHKIADAVAALSEDPTWCPRSVNVKLGDARSTGLRDEHADVVFCHPPYFALYRYSSDILRFEMEWLGVSRRETVRREIEDGFKTTNAQLVERYIADMVEVMVEARRISKSAGDLVIVSADSTLRNVRLNIMDPLVEHARSHGWRITKRAVRTVRFAQASYHRSADQRIQRPEDEVLIFKAV